MTESPNPVTDAIGMCTLVGVIAGVGALIFCAVLCLLNAMPVPMNTTYAYTNTSIVSLNDGSLTSGSFFLGSGSLNQRTRYFYYEGTADVYRLKHVSTDSATIHTDENESPYLTTITEVTCRTNRDGSSSCYDTANSWTRTYEFHVPKGTIMKNNFNLDGRV